MARRIALLIALLLPTLGCVQEQVAPEALLPELKGRWFAPNAAKLNYAFAADRYPNPPPPPADGDCRQQYVIFDKRGIVLDKDGGVTPIFNVKSVQRDGARLILIGNSTMYSGGERAQIEILLRNGEIRFDDIVDKGGRSVRYERFEHEPARDLGVTTIGDIFQLVLDLKPCRV